MSVELIPARAIRVLYDDARGRLDYGTRSVYQVSLVDAVEEGARMTATVHSDIRRAIRACVDVLFGAIRRTPAPPYDRLPGGEKDRLYLELTASFPSLTHRAFGTAAGELTRALATRGRAILRNALEHEGEFPQITNLARLTLVGLYLPAVVRGVLEEKLKQPDDPGGVAIRRGLHLFLAHALREIFRETEFAIQMRARLGEDPSPALSDEAGLFVLTDLEPTSWAIQQVLSASNAYRLTPDVWRLVTTCVREAAEEGHLRGEGRVDDWLAEPSNADRIAANESVVEEIASKLVARRGEMSAAVVLVHQEHALSDFLRSALAGSPFAPNAWALYTDPDGVESLVVTRSARKSVLPKLKAELRDYHEPFATRVDEAAAALSDAGKKAVMADAVRGVLPGVFRLHAERLRHAQVQRAKRSVELLMPGVATSDDLADGLRNRTLYLFAEKGPVFPLEVAPPPFLFAGDLRDFTPLTERLGSAATGSYLARFFNDLFEIASSAGAEVINFAGDAMYAASSGRGAGARALHILCRMEEALRAFQERARQEGDPLLEMGMALDVGSYFSFSVGPWKPTVSAHLNTVSRLMGSAREVALFLDRYALESVEPDIEEFLEALYAERDPQRLVQLIRPSPYPDLAERIAKDLGDPLEYVLRDDLFGLRDLREYVLGCFLRRKPEPFLPRVYVREGQLHNKGVVVTAGAFRRLKSELKMVTQDVHFSESEHRLVNYYFDPDGRRNRPAPPLQDHREVSWFLDAQTRTHRIFAAQPAVQLKGMAEPVELYELLPVSSFLSRRILPAAGGSP